MPVYFRSLAEMTAPLAGDGAASSREFRLERAAALEIEVPFVKALEASGDLDAYAAAFTDYLRAFTEPVLRLALADHPALDDLIGDVYARLARLVRRDPAAYEHHYIAVAVLSTRL